ncbi:hypothetical protein [Rufibacter latericius]|uniref:Uncharacterized protein n=1 Tax=Rufibacter latericius TaxID=2487040 RepID=A0A3M9MF07_9BACT|nr:hypothetical protein [Rufibacter latericius]RNI24149.1 hypothetical protein EFB08_17405 [Rufibacter latericius]
MKKTNRTAGLEKSLVATSAAYLLTKDGKAYGKFDSFFSACQHGLHAFRSERFLVERKEA